MTRLLLIFFIVSTLPIFSQSSYKESKLDSLKQRLHNDSLHIYRFRKARPYLNYHERNSLSDIKTVNFYGLQLGVVLFERHIVGLGHYFSTKNTKKSFTVFENEFPVTKRINIQYTSLFYQYVLINKRFFEIHLPLEIANGNMHTRYIDSLNRVYLLTDQNLFISSCGVQLILKPVKWFGLSANIGYRTSSEKLVTGYYYALGLWIGFKPVKTDLHYYLFKKRRYKEAVAELLKN